MTPVIQTQKTRGISVTTTYPYPFTSAFKPKKKVQIHQTQRINKTLQVQNGEDPCIASVEYYELLVPGDV